MSAMMAAFEIFDRLEVLQHEPDLVESFEKPILVNRIDLETVSRAARIAHDLRLKVDGKRASGMLVELFAKQAARLFRQRHRQHAVLDLVGVMDVAER